MNSSIEQELDRQDDSINAEQPCGPVGKIAQQYDLESDRLLGLLLKLDFEGVSFCHLRCVEKEMWWSSTRIICSFQNRSPLCRS